MVQFIATWVGLFPPCPDPISFIRLIRGAILSNLSSLKMANLGPPGFFPFFVYLPAASQDLGATGICGQAQGRAGQGRAGQGRAGQGRAGQGRAAQLFQRPTMSPFNKDLHSAVLNPAQKKQKPTKDCRVWLILVGEYQLPFQPKFSYIGTQSKTHAEQKYSDRTTCQLQQQTYLSTFLDKAVSKSHINRPTCQHSLTKQ